MGVEPTAACSAQPATDFEDRALHRERCASVGKTIMVNSIYPDQVILRVFQSHHNAPNKHSTETAVPSPKLIK